MCMEPESEIEAVLRLLLFERDRMGVGHDFIQDGCIEQLPKKITDDDRHTQYLLNILRDHYHVFTHLKYCYEQCTILPSFAARWNTQRGYNV